MDHLRSIFRNVALMLSIQWLVLLNIMGLRRGGITCFLIRDEYTLYSFYPYVLLMVLVVLLYE